MENLALEFQTETNISNDSAALWNVDDKTQENIAINRFKQNFEVDFSISGRTYRVKKRCTKGYFEKHLNNGDIKTCDWVHNLLRRWFF